MPIRLPISGVLFSLLTLPAILVAGCGGGEATDSSADGTPETVEAITVETGPFGSDEEFFAAADQVCSDYGIFVSRIPIYAGFAPSLTKEFEARNELDEATLADLESIEPTDSLAGVWETYLQSRADVLANAREIEELAAAGKEVEANELLNGDYTTAAEEREAAVEEVGTCEPEIPAADELADDTATATEAAAAAPQASNTIEDAAQEYLTALLNSDCDALFEAAHSQNYIEEPDPNCSESAVGYKGYELAATVSYGPVGAAVFTGEDGESSYQEFVLDLETGTYKYTTSVFAQDGGLQPPNEGIDSDQVVADYVTAIRANDPDGLTELLKTDVPAAVPDDPFVKTEPFDSLGTDDYGEQLVSDIRSDTDASPVLLGIDQAQGYYLLETEGTDYLLVTGHEPGSETEYRFSAYWAIAEPATAGDATEAESPSDPASETALIEAGGFYNTAYERFYDDFRAHASDGDYDAVKADIARFRTVVFNLDKRIRAIQFDPSLQVDVNQILETNGVLIGLLDSIGETKSFDDGAPIYDQALDARTESLKAINKLLGEL